MLQNNLFKKKDAINITPFLDIMLVLFVIIIVVASFGRNNAQLKKVKEDLLLKIKVLERKIKNLQKENDKLIKNNNLLTQQIFQEKNFVNQAKIILNQCTLEVEVMDDYLKIKDKKYSFDEFINLAKNGFIKNASFYIKKTHTASTFYKKLKEDLQKIGFEFDK